MSVQELSTLPNWIMKRTPGTTPRRIEDVLIFKIKSHKIGLFLERKQKGLFKDEYSKRRNERRESEEMACNVGKDRKPENC